MEKDSPASEPYEPFKKRFTLQERVDKFQKISKNHPEEVFVVVEPHPKSKNLPVLKKRVKIHKQNPLTRLRDYLRQQLKIKESESLYLFTNGHICTGDQRKMFEVYEQFKDEDGFLYVQYSLQEAFGGDAPKSDAARAIN